jgi:hypothetical protein
VNPCHAGSCVLGISCPPPAYRHSKAVCSIRILQFRCEKVLDSGAWLPGGYQESSTPVNGLGRSLEIARHPPAVAVKRSSSLLLPQGCPGSLFNPVVGFALSAICVRTTLRKTNFSICPAPLPPKTMLRCRSLCDQIWYARNICIIHYCFWGQGRAC